MSESPYIDKPHPEGKPHSSEKQPEDNHRNVSTYIDTHCLYRIPEEYIFEK
jgi:hypothetical protein